MQQTETIKPSAYESVPLSNPYDQDNIEDILGFKQAVEPKKEEDHHNVIKVES